jgi:hypothetical protein
MLLLSNRFIIIIFFLILNSNILGQSTSQYYHRNPHQVEEGKDVNISVTLFVADPIVSGMLFFRSIDQISYQEIPMQYVNGNWEAVIPGRNVVGDGIEYVVILHKRSWGRISVPLDDKPFDNPLSFNISQDRSEQKSRELVKTKKKTSQSGNYIDADILILSPETGSVNRPDEVVIAASLFNTDIVDTSNYRVLIDGKDYTKKSILDGQILTLTPNELPIGPHFVRLLFKTSYGLDITPIEWSFIISKGMVNMSESFRYKGNIGAMNTNSSASGIELVEQENNGKIDGELSWIKVRYSYRKSSRQSAFIQPLNRETLTLQVTDYLKLEYGDVYPSLSPFVLDGKRVRGRHIHVDLPWLDFQYVYGKISEQVNYKKGRVDGGYRFLVNNTELNPDGSRIFNLTRTGYTFPRDVSAARLAFTFFNIFSGGFHFLKAKDSFDEIPQYISNDEMFTFTPLDSTLDSAYIFNDYINNKSQYKFGEFEEVASSNGDTLTIPLNNWAGVAPKENLVAGFNFETALDNRNIIFQFAWNFSLTNNNIWDGPLTLDELDTKLDSLKDQKIMDTPLKGVPDPDAYENLFTINEFITPFVPIDPVVWDKNKIRAIINMPSSAIHARIKGSYTLNNLLVEYKQIGPEFYTFGNPYMSNNIREFTIKDRLSLLGRRLMFVVGYSAKDNKLSETVLNPLKTKTLMLNTTLVPGPGAPSVVFNMQVIGKTNGIDSVTVDSIGQFLKDNREDSRALNTLFSVNIPGSMGPISNTIAVNFNSITYTDLVATDEKYIEKPRKDDYLFQKSDTRTYSANISSRFPFPLRTVVSFNKTQIFMPMMDQNLNVIKNEIAWTSGSLSGTYSLKNNSIRISSGIDYMANGSDKNSVQIVGGKLGCDWHIISSLVFSAKSNIRLNRIKANKDDGIDNDNDGKVDNIGEVWSTSNSGIVFSLNYRF